MKLYFSLLALEAFAQESDYDGFIGIDARGKRKRLKLQAEQAKLAALSGNNPKPWETVIPNIAVTPKKVKTTASTTQAITVTSSVPAQEAQANPMLAFAPAIEPTAGPQLPETFRSEAAIDIATTTNSSSRDVIKYDVLESVVTDESSGDADNNQDYNDVEDAEKSGERTIIDNTASFFSNYNDDLNDFYDSMSLDRFEPDEKKKNKYKPTKKPKTTTSTSTTTTTSGNKYGSGNSGAYGDPHFHVVGRSESQPDLCFDYNGQAGDIITLLKDDGHGLKVTGKVFKPENSIGDQLYFENIKIFRYIKHSHLVWSV